MTVYVEISGRTVSDLTIGIGTGLNIESGGVAVGALVEDGGAVFVYSGGVATATTFDPGASGFVFAGGTASDTTVSRLAELYVSSGGTATTTTVGSGGTLIVAAEGTAVGTSSGAGAIVDVTSVITSGQTVSGLVVGNGTSFEVMAGGAAVSTTILSGGVVDAAGTVSGTVVRSSGMLAVYQGGIAFSTVVSGSGQFEVASGGSAAATTVESAGVFTVSGGLATDNVVLSGAVVSITDIVSSGQVVSGLIANAYTSITVDSGGVASGGVIMSGGLVDVVGTDIGTAVEFGGMEYVGGTSIDPIISGLMNGDDPTVSGALITGDGILALGFGGDVIDTTITGSGTLDLYIGAASGPVVFGGNGQLIVDGVTTAAVITGFNSGNTIDLQQLRYTSNWIATVEGQTLVVTEGTITEELQLAGNYNGATFQLAPDAGSDHTAAGGTLITVTNVPCFAAGTLITTDRGPIAVERLSVGDHVLTVEGVAEPILWIGSRAVDCRRHPAPNTIMPVRIRAHALGEGQPRRDLFLSPDHAIFAEGVLIPVKHLLNGSTIMQLTVDAVTYYHVELSRHAVILAEGLPVESYRDTGDRSAFADTHGVTTLHPTFGPDGADTALIAEALGYAPLRVTGPEVERVRNRAQTPAAAAPAPTRRAKG